MLEDIDTSIVVLVTVCRGLYSSTVVAINSFCQLQCFFFIASAKPSIMIPSGLPVLSFNKTTNQGKLKLSIGQNASTYFNTLIELKCPAVGFPLPDIVWEKNGQAMSFSKGTGETNATLLAEVNENAEFSCTVTNAAGRERKVSNIVVEGKL